MVVERLKGESNKAFNEFQKYLALPKPRKLELIASNEKHLEEIRRYYEKWDWEKRANSLDSFNRINKDSSKEISLLELEKKLMTELKNFSWIFSHVIQLMSNNLYNLISSNSGTDIETLSKQIALILKNLQDFLKIKEFLQEIDDDELELEKLIFGKDRVKNALFDLKNLILEEIERRDVDNF